jgi:glycosyltransferase involved in cell wall biosynthesis
LLPGLVPAALAAPGLVLNTGHRGLDAPHYQAFFARRGWSLVTFIHDLIPLTHPEYCRAGEAGRHARRLAFALQRSAAVIVNSVDTVQQLRAHALRHALPLPRLVVAPLAPSASPSRAAARPGSAGQTVPKGSPMFVTLGTIEPRKNHALLLMVWQQLIERHGSAAPHLVIIGRRGWDNEPVFRLLDRCPALATHVHERADVDDAELAATLADARALLFPSHCEGYGLPAVEALSAGTPVIASDLAVFRESVGEIPDYLPPNDGPGWLAMIESYMQDNSPARSAQVARLHGFRPTTWQQHHEKVDQALQELAVWAPQGAVRCA